LIAAYVNLVLGIKTVYTHFFYLPIMLAGMRYHKSVVYVGVIFGVFHVVLGYMQSGIVAMDTIFRMIILVLFSIGIRYLTRIIDDKQEEIVIERNTLEFLVKSIGDGVIAVDKDKKVTRLNKVAEKLTGWKSEEALGLDVSIVFKLVHENEHSFIENPIYEVLRTGISCTLVEEAILIRKNGDGAFIEDSASPIFDSEGELIGAVLIFRDVTEKNADRKRIQYLDFHDPLTGLFNRRFMREELERLDDAENYPISILVGDIDNLKLVNDTFGYIEGDNALIRMAECIKLKMRNNDMLVRSDGDTFAVIMPNTDLKETERIVKSIENECNSMLLKKGQLSITFGWDSRMSSAEKIEKFYMNAENHMYKRKINGLPSVRGKSLQTSMNVLFVKSPREKMHSERVSQYCVEIAKALEMDVRDIEDLKTISMLHDVGKIIVSENVLEKSGKLTKNEWIEMQRHPMIGYRIARDSLENPNLALAILNHHERWDGKGYPQGLKGDRINFNARIIAVADSYDAMISERPYKKVLTEEEAAHEIIINSGKQFDPEIARLFVEKVLKRSWE
jgi:diguanylate cyclase (GGDEF)-like protein/PAS domain S-box-containing protein